MAGYGKVTAPRRWRSSPDHPQAQLAYVTQDEIDMLVDANIYGSMDGKPNRGPKGIISLQGDIGGYEPPSQPSGGNVGGGGGHGGGADVWDPSPNIPPPNTPPPGWTPEPVIAPVITGTPNFGGSGEPDNIISDLDELLAATTGGNGNGNGINDINDVINETIIVDEIPTHTIDTVNPTNLPDNVWDLAIQEAANEGYELSYEGQQLMNEGTMPGSTEWIMHFGLPHIILTDSSGEPVTTGIGGEDYTDEYGQIIEGGNPIMTGLGQALLDQYDDPTGSYEEMVDDYWEMVAASQDPSGPSVPEQQQGYGPAGMTLAEFARNFWFSESLGDVEEKEARREAEGLGPATMSNMDRMFAKNFAAEAMGPDPFYDKDFSSKYYEDYDPIYAGMDLFERARS